MQTRKLSCSSHNAGPSLSIIDSSASYARTDPTKYVLHHTPLHRIQEKINSFYKTRSILVILTVLSLLFLVKAFRRIVAGEVLRWGRGQFPPTNLSLAPPKSLVAAVLKPANSYTAYTVGVLEGFGVVDLVVLACVLRATTKKGR